MEEVRVSEMTNINVSLYTLGRVIAALSTPNSQGDGGMRKQHIPYRDSKLTRLLQDSLGGNTRTRIIATLSPAQQCLDETISTLRFADRAKQVMAFVRVNEHRPVDQALVQRLQAEVKHLRELLQNAAADKGLHEKTPDSPPRPAALTALAEAQLLGYQETIEQLRRENTTLRENLTPKATDIAEEGNQESRGLDVAALQAANRALEDAIEHIVVNVRRFFRFDIEEEDLREDLDKVLSQLNGSIPGGASWCTSPSAPTPDSCFAPTAPQTARQGRDTHDSILPGHGNVMETQSAARGLPTPMQQWKGGAAVRGQPCQGASSQSEHITLPPVPGVAPERDAKSEKLAYRLRGKHADEVVVVMRKEVTEEDEERQLRKELKLAKVVVVRLHATVFLVSGAMYQNEKVISRLARGVRAPHPESQLSPRVKIIRNPVNATRHIISGANEEEPSAAGVAFAEGAARNRGASKRIGETEYNGQRSATKR